MKLKQPICKKQEKIGRVAAGKAKKAKSVFMQMHDGERPHEGSFYKALAQAFYAADFSNSIKLVIAFPEFFGKSVPEFHITEEDVKAYKKNM